MPVPNGFTTTSDRVEFLDFAGDRLIMRAFASENADPAVKIRTESADGAHGSANIYVPLSCIGDLIEGLQHLKNRAQELADQQATTTP